MDDYSALAYRIAGGVADVRGCLILSRDGLILGSYPDDETAVKPAWVRFASLGDPERSFVEFGDQVWVYVRRSAYGAFAVANAGVRPGLVIDQLEGILHSAEESRNRRDTLRVPEAAGAPSGKPRTSLHPAESGALATSGPPAVGSAEARHWARATPAGSKQTATGGQDAPAIEEVAAAASGVGQAGDASAGNGAGADAADGPSAEESGGASDPSNGQPESADSKDADTTKDTGAPQQKKGKDKHEPMELDADAVVDPVLLAKEFSGLLQVESGGDEATS
jgi:hypothetical protein